MNSIFKVTSSPNDKLEEYKNRAMRELNDFFGKEGNDRWTTGTPRILIIDDRNTINQIYGKETEGWLVGWSWGRNAILLLNPDNYATESTHKYSDKGFYQLIKHELCHSFFTITYGRTSSFSWINEGVSLYAAEQLGRHPAGKPFTGFLEGKNVYTEAGQAIKLLVDSFGKAKLFEFIKRQNKISKQEGLNNAFKEIYGSELNYDFFNNLSKIEESK